MISTVHWLVLFYCSSTILLSMTSAASLDGKSASNFMNFDPDEVDQGSKRAWKDVSGSWGKRGWNDLENSWGKRAWERLNGAWGKRLTLNPEESLETDFVNEISKRPEWSKFKGSWGKRVVPEGDRAGWANLKGLWGKRRPWEVEGGGLGKMDSKGPLETLHSLKITSE